MKRILGLLLLSFSLACPALSANDVKTGLTTAEVLCVLGSGLTNSADVSKVCSIVETLGPDVEKLLADAKAKGVGRIQGK